MEEKLDRIIELLEQLNSTVVKLNPKYINVDSKEFQEFYNGITDPIIKARLLEISIGLNSEL